MKEKKLALKLGFPTINIKLDFLPPFKIGVYAVKVKVKDKWYNAVANYGFAPTIKQDPLARNEQAILWCPVAIFLILMKILLLSKVCCNYLPFKKQS